MTHSISVCSKKMMIMKLTPNVEKNFGSQILAERYSNADCSHICQHRGKPLHVALTDLFGNARRGRRHEKMIEPDRR